MSLFSWLYFNNPFLPNDFLTKKSVHWIFFVKKTFTCSSDYRICQFLNSWGNVYKPIWSFFYQIVVGFISRQIPEITNLSLGLKLLFCLIFTGKSFVCISKTKSMNIFLNICGENVCKARQFFYTPEYLSSIVKIFATRNHREDDSLLCSLKVFFVFLTFE